MGGFQVPPMPAQLLEALKRQYAPTAPNAGAMPMAVPPSPVMQPGLPGGPPATAGAMPLAGRVAPPSPVAVPPAPPINMRAPGGVNQAPPGPPGAVPFLPGGGTPGATAPPKPPAVTDDPGVTPNANGMGAMPKQQDLGSYLNPALKQYQADQAGYQQADEANRIDPQQVKPRLWERLAGFALGATQLKDPQNAGAVAGEVVNRRRAGAELQRSTALAPWTQRLQQDREGLPLAEAQARTGYEQGELDLKTAAEKRDRFTAVTNADNKQAIADIREEVAQGNIDKAANLLDQKQKELELKTTHDAEWYAMSQAILDLRKEALEHKEKEAAKGKDHTAQVMGAETQKANALRAAEQAFNKAYSAEGFPADPKAEWSDEQHAKLAQFTQQRDEARQAAEDAYEAKSAELKGAPVDHQDVATWQKGSQTAAPVAAPSSAAPAGKPAATDALPKAPQGGAPLQDEAVAAQFLKAANGDPAKAVELAKAHGWTEK